MSKHLWLLGAGTLVCIGFLVACGSNYNSSSDGLVLVSSWGSGVVESFGFNLNNGHVSPVANTPNDTANETCVLNGIPTSLVMNPAGTYAFTIVNANSSCPGSKTGIATFAVNSDGSLTASGSLVGFHQAATNVDVVPNTMVIDSAGKYLFVADRATSNAAGLSIPGSVSVFSVASGSVTEVSGSPFFVTQSNTALSPQTIDIISVAVSPTVFPALGINGVQYGVCQVPGTTPPTAEYLYAVDDVNYQVFEFQVNTSSGALTIPSPHKSSPVVAADQLPVAVAVDPCDRFVFVSNSQSSKISAYVLCAAVLQPTCPLADGSLAQVSGSPFSLTGSANGPGPLQVDPFGNYLYVVGKLSNTVSPVKISSVTGSLTPGNPIATGLQPTSMAIRSDDTWMFISNYNAATVSQYSITPATGVLAAQPVIQTDNYPWGVAVK